MCLTVHMSRQLAVPPHVTEVPRRVVQRRTPPTRFPEGSWEQLDQVDLIDFFLLRLPLLKSCPHFLRARLRESFGVALAETGRSLLVTRWASRGHGSCSVLCQQDVRVQSGEMSLRDVFAAGRWIELLNQARQTGTRMSRATPGLDEAEDQRRRGNVAQSRCLKGATRVDRCSVGSENRKDSCRTSADTPTRTATADQSRRSRVQARCPIEFGQGIVRHSIAEFTIRERPRARRLHQRNAPRLLG